MSKRVCAEPKCPALVDRGARDGRCDQHRRARDKARGTATERGYGPEHRAERERWVPIVATGHVKCARCRQPIAPTDAWDLDHNAERDGYLGPSHASCNRATAGRI